MSDLLKAGKTLKELKDANFYGAMKTMESEDKEFRNTSFENLTNTLMEKNRFSMKSTFTNLKDFLKQRLDGDTNYWSEKQLDKIRLKKESAFKTKPSNKEKKALKDNYKNRQKELLALEAKTKGMMKAIKKGEDVDNAEYISNVEKLRDLNLEILRNAGYVDNTYDEDGNILTRGDDIFLETKAKYDLELLRMKQGSEEEADTTTETKNLENFYKSYRGENLTGLYWRVKEEPKLLQQIKELNKKDYDFIIQLGCTLNTFIKEEGENMTPEQHVKNRIMLDNAKKNPGFRKRAFIRQKRLEFIEKNRPGRLEKCKEMTYDELEKSYYIAYNNMCISEDAVDDGKTLIYKELRDIEKKSKISLRINEVTPMTANEFSSFADWTAALRFIAKFELYNGMALREQKIPSLASRLDLTPADIRYINEVKRNSYLYSVPTKNYDEDELEDDLV